jgi:hypothetical protein
MQVSSFAYALLEMRSKPPGKKRTPLIRVLDQLVKDTATPEEILALAKLMPPQRRVLHA